MTDERKRSPCPECKAMVIQPCWVGPVWTYEGKDVHECGLVPKDEIHAYNTENWKMTDDIIKRIFDPNMPQGHAPMGINSEILNQKIEAAVAADTSLGCGPGTSLGFATGSNDPIDPVCVAHDKIDDSIHAGDTSYTYAQNDKYFRDNIAKREQELEFLGHPAPLRTWLYPKLIRAYRWIMGEK